MKFLNTLLVFLLLSPVYSQEKPAPAATTNPAKVKGLTLPQSITVSATDFAKKIVPVFDDPSKVLDCKWKVIGTGEKDPEFEVRGTGKDSYLVVAVPADKDAVLVLCYALYGGDRPWVTEAAQTMVEWGTGLPPPTTTPPTTTPPTTVPPTTTPPTTVPPGTVNPDEIFASVKNVHAMLILDMKTVNPEVAVISQNKSFFQQHFQQPGTNNVWHQNDIRSVDLKQAQLMKLVDATGKVIVPLPAVVLIDSTVKPAKLIGIPISIPLTGNPTQTITNLLTAIAQALKR
jgi:hypothetical protein